MVKDDVVRAKDELLGEELSECNCELIYTRVGERRYNIGLNGFCMADRDSSSVERPRPQRSCFRAQLD